MANELKYELQDLDDLDEVSASAYSSVQTSKNEPLAKQPPFGRHPTSTDLPRSTSEPKNTLPNMAFVSRLKPSTLIQSNLDLKKRHTLNYDR